MGQKINPLGLRVGITKKHQSQWFARFHKNKYAQSVLEDRMLRQTLSRLFPQLLTAPSVSKKQRDNEPLIVPKVTQIKIERGLIPYEIGIQIHAENCDLIKSSIENLKINRDFICELHKTRRYLQHLRFKLNESINESGTLATTLPPKIQDNVNKESNNVEFDKPTIPSNGGRPNSRLKKERSVQNEVLVGGSLQNEGSNDSFRKGDSRFKRLTRSQLRRQRLILKRLRKRQSIRRRYKQLVREARFFLKKQGNKVVQKLTLNKNLFKGGGVSSPERARARTSGLASSQIKKSGNNSGLNKKAGNIRGSVKLSSRNLLKNNVSILTKTGTNGPTRLSKSNYQQKKPLSILQSRIKKKFVCVYRNKMNKKFLQVLKNSLLKHQNATVEMLKQNGETRENNVYSLSLETFSESVNKKWNFKVIQPRLVNKPLAKLINLVTVLEQKSLKKMESLRKEFITFGTVSISSYYQMLKFLKDLKEYVSQVKRKQRLQFGGAALTHLSAQARTLQDSARARARSGGQSTSALTKGEQSLPLYSRRVESSTAMLIANNVNSVIAKKLNNIENECRKIQLIEYLKQLVKKHRSDNIYLYLSTIAEARKDLRKLKQFTKKHANFLFGAISTESDGSKALVNKEEQKVKIQERVRLILDNSHSKADLEKTLQYIFLEQIDKQRNMYIDNVQLTPKIAIKFYTVSEKSVKAKASVVAHTVVEALEQRKAFRKVIKDAKEELMRGPSPASAGLVNRVKGVKIQLSGRLNGAEIARSEWVRAGRVPLQTLRANLDYSYKTANTIYGIIGVKVWIFKGYTKLL